MARKALTYSASQSSGRELEDFEFIKTLALEDEAKIPVADEDAEKMFNSITWQIYWKLKSGDCLTVWEG